MSTDRYPRLPRDPEMVLRTIVVIALAAFAVGVLTGIVIWQGAIA